MAIRTLWKLSGNLFAHMLSASDINMFSVQDIPFMSVAVVKSRAGRLDNDKYLEYNFADWHSFTMARKKPHYLQLLLLLDGRAGLISA